MIRADLAALEARLAEACTGVRSIRTALDAAIGALTGEAPPPPVVLPSEPAPPQLPPPDSPHKPTNIPGNIPAQGEATWMPHAWAEFGVRETAGSGHNPRVLSLFRDAGHPTVTDDETAWCAALVGAALQRAGVSPSGSLMARSYLSWGEPLGDRRGYGAVAVLSRGSDPALGHVGFVVGAAGGKLFILGGNQSNAVSVQAFPRERLLPDGLRWPAQTFGPALVGDQGQGVRPPVDTARRAQDGTAGGLTPDRGPGQAPAAADNLPAFAVSLAHILDVEGGWSDDPDDPGGATNFGITIADYARYKGVPESAALKEALRNIPRHEVEEIYLLFYWREGTCAPMPAPVGLFHFDCAVNQGVGTAARLLQTAARVDVDGEIGPITLAAVRGAEPMALLQAYAELRRARYQQSPRFWKFGRGWLARVDKTLARAAALTSTTIPA